MNIKATLYTLFDLYEGSRRAGHTTAAIEGAVNTPRAVVVFSHYSALKVLKGRNGVASGATLATLESLRGRRAPIVLDNSAVVALADAALTEIERLEIRVNSLEQDVQRLKLRAGHAEARHARAIGEISWLRLPLWKKALRWLRHADLRRWRREASQS